MHVRLSPSAPGMFYSLAVTACGAERDASQKRGLSTMACMIKHMQRRHAALNIAALLKAGQKINHGQILSSAASAQHSPVNSMERLLSNKTAIKPEMRLQETAKLSSDCRKAFVAAVTMLLIRVWD